MTTLTADALGLLRACDQSPDDDTPRLLLADCLDEVEARYVRCPKCQGTRRVKRPIGSETYILKADGFGPDGDPWRWVECRACNGSGEIPDPAVAALKDRAELIRVQCELGRHGPPHKKLKNYDGGCIVINPSLGGPDYREITLDDDHGLQPGDRVDVLSYRPGKSPKWVYGFKFIRAVETGDEYEPLMGLFCVDDSSRPWTGEPLAARERALLAKHPEWRLECPRCATESGMACGLCGNAGRVGALERGLLGCVRVPSLATVMGGIEPICGACDVRNFVRDYSRFGLNQGMGTCSTCHGRGRTEAIWCPTPWASRVFGSPWNRCARVECGDRRPNSYFMPAADRMIWRWDRCEWSDITPDTPHPGYLPPPFHHLCGVPHDTPESATLALSVALGAWLRKNVKLAAAAKEEKK